MLRLLHQMAQRVGDHLKHDPLRLRFTSVNANHLGPKAVIKRALNQSVGDLTQNGYYAQQHVALILYYEKLDVSIIELETKKSLKITWTGSHNKEEVSHLATLHHLAYTQARLLHLYSQLTRSCCPRPAHLRT